MQGIESYHCVAPSLSKTFSGANSNIHSHQPVTTITAGKPILTRFCNAHLMSRSPSLLSPSSLSPFATVETCRDAERKIGQTHAIQKSLALSKLTLRQISFQVPSKMRKPARTARLSMQERGTKVSSVAPSVVVRKFSMVSA